MKQELLQRIPRLPHWRWVLFCGAGHPEYTEPVAQLDRYLSEEKIDVGLGDLEDPDEDVSRAIRIFESEPPIRKTIESMLFERCSSTLIQDALYHKYKEPISDVVVRRYKKFFYDTEVLNNYDIAKYYESSSQRIPKPPPVPGSFKEAYVAFQNGVDIDIDPQKAMEYMFQTSFFRAQELRQYGWPADDKVLKYHKDARDTIRAMQEGDLNIEIPDEFNYEIEYPDATASEVFTIEGYDPDDDPNEEYIDD